MTSRSPRRVSRSSSSPANLSWCLSLEHPTLVRILSWWHGVSHITAGSRLFCSCGRVFSGWYPINASTCCVVVQSWCCTPGFFWYPRISIRWIWLKMNCLRRLTVGICPRLVSYATLKRLINHWSSNVFTLWCFGLLSGSLWRNGLKLGRVLRLRIWWLLCSLLLVQLQVRMMRFCLFIVSNLFWRCSHFWYVECRRR